MAGQHDVCRTTSGTLAVVIQSNLLDETRTRVIAPLLRKGRAGRPMQSLNPVIPFGGEDYVLMPQLLATLSLDELGQTIGSIADRRDIITRAIDALLSGV